MQDLEFIIKRNLECLIKFGITDFDHQLRFFRRVLKKIGIEQIMRWRELLLELVYWPRISLGPTDEYDGWKVRPCPWYFQMANQGRFFWLDKIGRKVKKRKPWILQGGVYLIDSRRKPALDEGLGHKWENDYDFLGKHLENHRMEKGSPRPQKLPPASRFCVGDAHCLALTQTLAQQREFHEVEFWRKETASEWNFITQCFPFMPRRWDGETDSRVIFDDFLLGKGTGENFLVGGSFNQGGLSDIDSIFAGRADSCKSRWGISIRFLGVLALET